MVRLNLTIFKYLTTEDFRVLMAIELGMRNHEHVPVNLIETLAKVKKVNIHKVISTLLKNKLIEHYNQKYDGYSLNYLGYDFLAIRALLKKGLLVKILSRMGVGKESDVFHCLINTKGFTKDLNDEEIEKAQADLFEEIDDNDNIDDFDQDELDNNNNSNNTNHQKLNLKQEMKQIEVDDLNQLKDVYANSKENFELVPGILKLARLGRTSFRAVKSKRDFVKNKSHYNWLYLSRLSSQTENKFLNGLYASGFPVPKPYGYNRHAILMEYIPGYQLSRVTEIENPEKVYNTLTGLLYKLAESGLVHGDFNEFNILISQDEKVKIIDFTQMISRDHEQANLYFSRDLAGVKHYFMKKFHLTIEEENDKQLSEIERIDYLDIKYDAFGSLKKNDEKLNLEIIEKDEEEIDEMNDLHDEDHDQILKELNINEKDEINTGVEAKNDEKISKTGNTKANDSIIITKQDIMKKIMKGIKKEYKPKTKQKGSNQIKSKTMKKGVDY